MKLSAGLDLMIDGQDKMGQLELILVSTVNDDVMFDCDGSSDDDSEYP